MLQSYFNSRPHGGRPTMIVYPSDDLAFQLTPSRRATNVAINIPAPQKFQLTPSRRATKQTQQNAARFTFQLTPSRRATTSNGWGRKTYAISTHALTEGDGQTPQGERVALAFQLTPSRRATRTSSGKSEGVYFNSRPHGGRHVRLLGWPWRLHFNSRPHGGRLFDTSFTVC